MNTIDKYLAELDSLLSVDRKSRTAILEEVHDHLLESTEKQSARGISRLEMESNAISTFGSPVLIARHFNAAFGAKAVRRAPIIAIASGLLVVLSFLITAINQPKVTTQATTESQISFFLAVIAFQIAIVAGACGASRALSMWRTSATSGSSRLYVRRCTVTSMTALLSGVIAMTANFIFDINRGARTNKLALILGASSMFIVASVGLLNVLRLKVNPADEDAEASTTPAHVVFTLGDIVIKVVRRYPIPSCVFITSIATAWTMTHAETKTFTGSWPWGIAEAVSVIAGFLLLGPTLGLRNPFKIPFIKRAN